MLKGDWLDDLKLRFSLGKEKCHGGCGDVAERLRLDGRYVGAWCKDCLREVAYGETPMIKPPRWARRS